MSFNNLFSNQSHSRTNIHNDQIKVNLGSKLNSVRDRKHTQKEIPIFDVGNSVIYQPVSTYGASLLDVTSLADLRTQILENTNEEAIRLLADGNNEINFYTGGTGASNLRLQIKDNSIEVKNYATLYCFDLNVDPNRSLIASYIGSDAGQNLNLRYGSSVYMLFNNTNIVAYKSIIPNGVNAEDLGNSTNYFGETHTNYLDVKSHVFMDFFNSTDVKNEGFFFRPGFSSGSGLQDNMSIRAHNNSGSNDGIMISAYGGISLNSGYIGTSNDNGTDGATNRAMLIRENIKCYVPVLPYADGVVDIGTSGLKYNEIYGNNIRAYTNLYASSIRPYSGSTIHFHNADITTDNNRSISVDSIYSSASNRDLYLGNSSGDIKMRFINGAGGETNTYSSIVPNNADGLLDLGSPSKYFGNVYATSVNCSTVTGNDLEANVSIIARGNNSYLSVEDDTSANGKVQLMSENSSTYTGYITFFKNDIRQLYLGFDNNLQFENGSNFTIRSDQQTYMSFIHDANFANRKININVDLIPSSNSYDLGSFNNRFVQIHGTTINASSQISTDLIAPYAGGISTSVQIDADFLPINPGGGGSGTRKLGNGANLWDEVYATNTTIQTSDRNMKKDITPITNALQFVRKLEPVQYKWKKNSHGRTHTGFIAQDVLQANPLGLGDNWSGYVDTGHGLGLRYGEFISINTQAIKELDSKLTKLVSGISTGTKVDLNYHTDSSELVERLEILENKKPLETVVEEYDDSELKQQITQLKTEIIDLKIENKKQEDCISQLIADNMNLTEKLNMLMERFDKFVNDKPNVEMKIIDDSDMLLSEGGGEDHAEMIESRLYTLETKVTKLSNKQSKLVTAINKLKK